MRQLQRIRFLVSVIWSVSLVACTHSASDERVVERSKENMPTWVQQTPDVLNEDKHRYVYTSARSHIENLPVGVKETQLAAVERSGMALTSNVQRQVEQRGIEAGVALAASDKPQLQVVVEEQVKALHARYAMVRDIFFEKVESLDRDASMRRFYRVYVLVDFRKEHLPAIFAAIAGKLQSSRNASLKKLGKALKKANSQPLGH